MFYDNIILILNQLHIHIRAMLRRNSNYQNPSPMRSPIKAPIRPVSPIRCSPYSRQAPLSPIKARIAANNSTTPNKSRPNQRVQFVKSPLNCKENVDVGYMQKTLKNGVGLFQQLAYQNKMGSERKESRMVNHNTNPFQYSEKKRETIGNYSKNSFAALIQNVKEIESIQASKANYYSNQVSFKTIEKSSHMEGTIKHEPIIRTKNSQHHLPIPILESFASPCQIQAQECEKAQKQEVKVFEVAPVTEVEQVEQKSRVEEEPAKKKSEEIVSSFEDVILLIKKASERVRDESCVVDDEVKMSIDEQLSFNMNPFI